MVCVVRSERFRSGGGLDGLGEAVVHMGGPRGETRPGRAQPVLDLM